MWPYQDHILNLLELKQNILGELGQNHDCWWLLTLHATSTSVINIHDID